VLFEVDHCKPELYSLMLKNAKNMTDEEIKNILDWIENKSYFVSKEIKGEKEQVEKIIAYEKKELLSALLPSEKDIVKERYEQYDSVNSEPLCHPGVYISVESFEGYESPVSEETMAMMSSEEILTLLQQFKEKGSFGVPSELGLANTLEACIAKNPQKFVSHLYVYESVDPLYVYSILKGLSDAFEKGVIFDLEPVFDYIDKILPRILHVKGDKEHHMNWLIGQIATFIQKGTTKDENSFEIDLMHRSKEILISLNDRVIAKNESHENAVSYTINTEKGKILSAMLCLSLWYARNKPTEKRWVQDIKDIFDYELHNEKTIELITTISSHIRHFMYLDKEWVLDNIDEIFFISDETLWKSAMQGYLQFPHPTNKMFMLLKEGGHYEKALDPHHWDIQEQRNLVFIILHSFFKGWESLKDEKSLIWMLLHKEEYSLTIIGVVHSFDKDVVDNALIRKIWNCLYFLYKDNTEILTNLLLWLKFIDYIDEETKKWCMAGARHMKIRDFLSIVKYLDDLVVNNIAQVGSILQEIVKNIKYLYSFDNERISHIVKILYENGYKSHANSICECYAHHNIHFLREMYREYN